MEQIINQIFFDGTSILFLLDYKDVFVEISNNGNAGTGWKAHNKRQAVGTKKSQFQFLFYEMKKEGKEAEAQNNEDKGFSFPTFSSL